MTFEARDLYLFRRREFNTLRCGQRKICPTHKQLCDSNSNWAGREALRFSVSLRFHPLFGLCSLCFHLCEKIYHQLAMLDHNSTHTSANAPIEYPQEIIDSPMPMSGQSKLDPEYFHRPVIRTPYYYCNPLHIENRYLSLLSLIDIVYPPLVCPLCDHISLTPADSDYHYRTAHPSKPRRFLCLHPHCELRFKSRGALRFHITRSHLVKEASSVQPEPPFIHFNVEPPMGTFPSNSNSRKLQESPVRSYEPFRQHRHPHPSSFHTAAEPVWIPYPGTSTTSANNNNTNSNNALSFRIHTAGSFASKESYNNNNNKKPVSLSPASEALVNSVYHPLLCPCCHEQFPKKTNVIKHMAEKHPGQEPYRCVYPNCNSAHSNQSYATRDGLLYHIMRIHDDHNADGLKMHDGDDLEEQQQTFIPTDMGKPISLDKR